jgi:hypothetical protein
MRHFFRLGFVVALAMAATGLVAQQAQATSVIQFGKIQYDSPGTDTRSNASLNAEYFTVKNLASTTKDLYGVTVHDAQNHTYKFSTHVKVAAHSYVRVHTGKGPNSSHDRYWGQSNYIWNNSGDKATMKTANGTVLDTCSWSHDAPGYTNC